VSQKPQQPSLIVLGGRNFLEVFDHSGLRHRIPVSDIISVFEEPRKASKGEVFAVISHGSGLVRTIHSIEAVFGVTPLVSGTTLLEGCR
jgi:hypothetical protein